MRQRIYLSASQVHNADDCRRKYWYEKVAKVRTKVTAAALPFGTCIDLAVREYLAAVALGLPSPDLVDGFTKRWQQAVRVQELRFPATQSPEDLERIGTTMMRAFPQRWDELGYTVALNAEGQPLVDVKLTVDLGDDVFLVGAIDLMAYTREGAFGVLDVKTGASVHSVEFALRSDQLTAYDVLVDAHREAMELPELEKLGFLTCLKRKKEASIEDTLVDRRSASERGEFVQKCQWLAEDIRRGRFPRSSRLAYNTPCDMCDFAGHCVKGSQEGLVFPQGNVPGAIAIAMAA